MSRDCRRTSTVLCRKSGEVVAVYCKGVVVTVWWQGEEKVVAVLRNFKFLSEFRKFWDFIVSFYFEYKALLAIDPVILSLCDLHLFYELLIKL